MNSRERVQVALNHQEPDRIPFDLGGTPMSGIHHVAYRNLRHYLGLPEEQIKISDSIQLLAAVSDDMKDRLQVDIHNIAPRSSAAYNLGYEIIGDYSTYVDEWGIGWRSPVDGGLYYDMYSWPLAPYDTIEEIKQNYKWPYASLGCARPRSRPSSRAVPW